MNATTSASSLRPGPLQPDRLPPKPNILQRLRSDMFENAHMDTVNDVARPPVPIALRPHGVRIPGRALNTSAAARQFGQQELPLMRFEVAVQMFRLDMSVGRQLVQRSRIGGNPEAQQTRFIPNGYRLDKRSCRKHAVPHRSRSVPKHLRANRIGYP